MTQQFKRKAMLTLVDGDKGLDLSEFHFTFSTKQQDVESPNNCRIRIYNLSQSTVNKIQGEFSKVVLQAGYEGQFGVIFQGTIKQFYIGKQNGTDTYLDLLAADGDMAYNLATINESRAAGWTQEQIRNAAIESMKPYGVQAGALANYAVLGGTIPAPRGKVMFGMSRAVLRGATQNVNASWNVQDGRINVVEVDGYLPGEVVVLTAQTGLIGVPEQTNEGVIAKCLLNPRIIVGGLVQVDNKTVNRTVNQANTLAHVPYNSRGSALQFLATVANDGFYRCFVAEHTGDTRGSDWYTQLTLLALNPASKKVTAAP